MKKRLEIQEAIFKSRKNAGVKGHRVNIEEMLIWNKQQMLVALIRESPLTEKRAVGTSSYGLYSLMADQAIPEGTKIYQNLLKKLPDVTKMTSRNADKEVDFLRKMELENAENDSIDQYVETGKLSSEYASVLEELSGMVSPEAAKIYQFILAEL